MLLLEVPPVMANFVSEQSAVVVDVPDTGCCNETAVKSSRIWQMSEKNNEEKIYFLKKSAFYKIQILTNYILCNIYVILTILTPGNGI